MNHRGGSLGSISNTNTPLVPPFLTKICALCKKLKNSVVSKYCRNYYCKKVLLQVTIAAFITTISNVTVLLLWYVIQFFKNFYRNAVEENHVAKTYMCQKNKSMQ